MSSFVAPYKGKPAMLALFIDPHQLVDAIVALREQGYRGLDAATPFPVHGLSEALGMGPSWMPRVTKTAFFTGATLGLAFQLWANGWTWPINVAGKPFFSVPASMPITFECGILCAAICTFYAVFIAGRLYPVTNFELLDSRITNDRFALFVPTGGQNVEATERLLQKLGAQEVQQLG